MLHGAWFITRHDLRTMLRQKETLLWTFLMPPVFFFFIGTVTGGFGGPDPDEPDPLALEAPPDAGFLVDQVERRLEERNFVVERLGGAAFAAAPRRLALPAGFSDSLLAGRRVKVVFGRADADDLDADFDELRVRRAIYSVLADVVVTGLAGEAPTPQSVASLAAAPRSLTLEVVPAGRRRDPPVGFAQAIPGTMVMFTMIVVFTSGAVLLVIERQQGLLRRLASTPISRGSAVLGKWGGRMAIGLVQLGFGMLVSTLLFKMRWGPDLPMVIAVLAAWAGLAAVLGLVLGNLARSEGQAVALGVLGSMILASLGGCWWPIEVTPAWMQQLALFLPTGWAMDGLHRLVSFESGAASAVPHVLAMILAAVGLGWIAARTFRYQ